MRVTVRGLGGLVRLNMRGSIVFGSLQVHFDFGEF